jgi:hypothetical protein
MKVYVAKYKPGERMPSPPPKGCNILIHTSATGTGGPLSPYCLRNEEGCIFENIWQFSKVYPKVRYARIPLSRYNPDITIWSCKGEDHILNLDNPIPNESYWNWRARGFHNQYPVRYPNTYQGRKEALFSVWKANDSDTDVFYHNGVKYVRLDYITARNRIYYTEYKRLVENNPAYQKIKKMLKKKSIQIVEVDGPDPENYKDKDWTWEGKGLLMNEENLEYLINDPSHSFGHGYALAAILLGIEFE